MSALWTGRLSGDVDADFKVFNDSLPFDRRLVGEDIDGSVAWAAALARAGVLDRDEKARLVGALEDLRESLRADPSIIVDADDEDVHSFVERELVERLGDLGKKLHTGRSRNDQVATDLRLWTMRAIDARRRELLAVIDALIDLAERERDTVFPGYTHLQRAQPILFAHWCLAYVAMLQRDLERLDDARRRTARCPLGSAALAGTAYPIDRVALANALGFESPSPNSLDAVSDRDFVIESLSAIALCAVHLSRLAEDLVFYASSEAALVDLPDALTTGSSIMPQKKNPDALELIRGKTGGHVGRLVALLTTLKALPLAYNKDMQEDKLPLFQSMDELSIALRVLVPLVAGLSVRRDAARAAAIGGYANATELADHLVAQGVPFRDAHHQVGRLVAEALERGVGLEDLSIETIRAEAPAARSEVFVDLTVEAAVAKRAVLGGTAPREVDRAIRRMRGRSAERAVQVERSDVSVRTATVADLDAIRRLVDHWADAGENLPRTADEILTSIHDFAVAVRGEQVIGCGALWVYTPELAEIRSVGLDPNAQGGGIGTLLVEHLVREAAGLGVPKVFVLTRVPSFFDRLGFRTVTINSLPQKILKDCARCPKQSCCDEVALVRETGASPRTIALPESADASFEPAETDA